MAVPRSRPGRNPPRGRALDLGAGEPSRPVACRMSLSPVIDARPRLAVCTASSVIHPRARHDRTPISAVRRAKNAVRTRGPRVNAVPRSAPICPGHVRRDERPADARNDVVDPYHRRCCGQALRGTQQWPDTGLGSCGPRSRRRWSPRCGGEQRLVQMITPGRTRTAPSNTWQGLAPHRGTGGSRGDVPRSQRCGLGFGVYENRSPIVGYAGHRPPPGAVREWTRVHDH